MRIRTINCFLAIVLTCGMAQAAPDVTFACAEVDGWNAGRKGQPLESACVSEAYAEAHRLGAALAELRSRHTSLEQEITTNLDANVGVLRRRQRQLEVDIEAIRGVATIRGWPDDVASAQVPEAVQ